LCIIAWYYLLRVGEYTFTKIPEQRQTVQLRLQDVSLWHHHEKLNLTLPLHYLLAHCTSATLCINNQKNGKRNSIIHHHCTNTLVCPVKTIIHRIHHIRTYSIDSNVMIGTYFTPTQPTGRHVTSADINTLLKSTVKALGLQRYNICPSNISSHSLRAGGAMALHLNGVPTHTIQKMGRWSSDTFLVYIHHQIAAFSTNLSREMSRDILFHNVAINPSTAPHCT
jgi:Phage integrase family